MILFIIYHYAKQQLNFITGENVHLAIKKIVEIYVVAFLCIFGISGLYINLYIF